MTNDSIFQRSILCRELQNYASYAHVAQKTTQFFLTVLKAYNGPQPPEQNLYTPAL